MAELIGRYFTVMCGGPASAFAGETRQAIDSNRYRGIADWSGRGRVWREWKGEAAALSWQHVCTESRPARGDLRCRPPGIHAGPGRRTGAESRCRHTVVAGRRCDRCRQCRVDRSPPSRPTQPETSRGCPNCSQSLPVDRRLTGHPPLDFLRARHSEDNPGSCGPYVRGVVAAEHHRGELRRSQAPRPRLTQQHRAQLLEVLQWAESRAFPSESRLKSCPFCSNSDSGTYLVGHRSEDALAYEDGDPVVSQRHGLTVRRRAD